MQGNWSMKRLLMICFIALWLYACILAGEKVSLRINNLLFGLSADFYVITTQIRVFLNFTEL